MPTRSLNAAPPVLSASAPLGEEVFRLLFERSSDAILLLDSNTFTFVDCNDAAVRLLRARSKRELLDAHPWQLSPERQPDGQLSAEKANALIDDVIRDGTSRFEWIHLRIDGSEVPVEVVLTSVQLGDRPLVVTVWRDITERRTMERALRESENKFRLLFERSTDPMQLLDLQTWRFIDCNAACVALMHCSSKGELIGLAPWDISPEVQPDGERSEDKARAVQEELMARGTARFEWTHRRFDGSTFPTEITLTVIEEVAAHPLLFVIWREISERKRAEMEIRDLNTSLEHRVAQRTIELERANAQLKNAEQELLKTLAQEKELSELKSSFVSMVSHEFRTPLAVILSSAELLKNHLERLGPNVREEQLTAICSSTKHMSKMIDEVLLLGKVEGGQMRFAPAPIDLRELCVRLVDEMHSATQHRCPIEFDGLAESVPTSGDEALLRHILGNLLSNAVKYSPAGEPVRLEVARDGQNAVLVVADRGVGIPAADLPKIFQAFQRASNVGQIAGTGLGLVIVRRCVDLHGGTIDLQSEVGQGTRVTVRLPLFETGRKKAAPRKRK
ncbi:MAG TPA: PAS domain-containing sensor histidine kinase [Chthoniobacteraceae bacterium]|jgi:PAS domain S-box-containing protein